MFRTCLPVAADLLRPGGLVVLQVRGPAQADAVAALAARDVAHLAPLDVTVVSETRAVLDLVRRRDQLA